MNDDLVPRRYTEQEAGEILRRAAEMQRAEPSVADPSGFSLNELEEVAREAGIDPAVVRQAASELDVRADDAASRALLGAPINIRLESEVPGEYPADRFDELLPLIQKASPLPGHAGAVGRSFTWTAHSESNTSALQVVVSASGGRTLIRIEQRLGGLAAGLFGGIIGGLGAGVGVGVGAGVGASIGSTLVGVGFPVLMLGGSYYLARAIYAAWVKRETAKLRTLLGQLSSHAGSVIADASLPPAIDGDSTRG